MMAAKQAKAIFALMFIGYDCSALALCCEHRRRAVYTFLTRAFVAWAVCAKIAFNQSGPFEILPAAF